METGSAMMRTATCYSPTPGTVAAATTVVSLSVATILIKATPGIGRTAQSAANRSRQSYTFTMARTSTTSRLCQILRPMSPRSAPTAARSLLWEPTRTQGAVINVGASAVPPEECGEIDSSFLRVRRQTQSTKSSVLPAFQIFASRKFFSSKCSVDRRRSARKISWSLWTAPKSIFLPLIFLSILFRAWCR